MKFNNWNNQALSSGILTMKIDGVRCHIDREKGYCVSRAGNRLLHTDAIFNKYVDTCVMVGEIFISDFKTTIQAVKTHTASEISVTDFYPIAPICYLDERLFLLRSITELDVETINGFMDNVITRGYEGLVHHGFNDELTKIKPTYSLDVPITGFTTGTGRNSARIGALITPHGCVSSGLTDEIRSMDRNALLGKIIEVEAMGMTANDKFRHPRFLRFRPDKDIV